MNQNDPYQILGVSPNADDETIKHAYHELARKYHPDRYTDSDLLDLAKEKMQTINAAYEQIQRMRAAQASAGTQREGGYKGGDAYQNPGAGSSGNAYGHCSAQAREQFLRIRNHLRGGNVAEAERLLYAIPEIDRCAEWFFLLGHVQLHRGAHMDARQSFETAYRMEPGNNEYWQAKERANQQARQYGGGYQTGNAGAGCCDCDLCSALICTDCCCECMGGDFIPCC